MRFTDILAALAALALLRQGASLRIIAPGLPINTLTGGEVLLEVGLDSTGAPQAIVLLSGDPPFSDALRVAVRQWRLPVGDVGPQVLVAGIFRSPALLELRPLPAPPSPPPGSHAVPFPIQWERPPYPPDALGDGVVIVEAWIGADGLVHQATVVHSSPAFDDAARQAAARWRFRPALRDGRAVPSVAFLVFGFRAPVTAPSTTGANVLEP
jgi:TonB family protein